MKLLIIIITIALYSCFYTQDKPAYRIFTPEGRQSSYSEMIKAILKADMVFFGELHDDPVAH